MSAGQDDLVERVARIIADELGDDLDHAFETKSEWVTERGEKGGRYRDINEPRRGDYIDAARAAIAAMPEITRLRADNAALVEALTDIAEDQERIGAHWVANRIRDAIAALT